MLARLLLAEPLPARAASLADLRASLPTGEPPFVRAVRGGLAADRLGYAFAAGYAAALARLVGDVGVATLCATEAGGAHPAGIRTTLSPDGRITGTKAWATLAGDADRLLVVASTGEEGGRNRLRVARVAARGPGVTMVPMPPTPFAPEIPHFEVRLDGAPAEAVLEGDGWERYVKPFRTVEDVHVCGAAAAYVVGAARTHGWPRALVARLVADVVALGALATEPPEDAATHVALAGVLDGLRTHLAEADPLWAGEEGARWRRDAPLLQVAERARAARTEAAWRRLAG